MPVPFRALDVCYEPEAQTAIDDACEAWLRTDDQVFLLEWAIARDPKEGKPLTESGQTRALTLEGAKSIGAPTVTFVYVIEQNRVVVKQAKFENAKPKPKSQN